MDHRVRFSRANAAVQLPVDEMAFRAAFLYVNSMSEKKFQKCTPLAINYSRPLQWFVCFLGVSA